jgi:UDPglucose--hexose-1-phosphate uridylyltransferase
VQKLAPYSSPWHPSSFIVAVRAQACLTPFRSGSFFLRLLQGKKAEKETAGMNTKNRNGGKIQDREKGEFNLAEITFDLKQSQASFLDPADGYAQKILPFEVRVDPLTGHRSRILSFRRRKLPRIGIPSEMIEASKPGCPFCPDQISSSTPRFLPGLLPEGRMQKGRALLFPNSFPYAPLNWVVVFSGDHFLSLNQFSAEILRDAFLVARDGILEASRGDSRMTYASINWNYLPQSGGGLFHPHLQVVVEEGPTVSHREVLDGLEIYQAKNASSFWKDYLAEEVKRGERYIGHRGDVHFITAFSPRGILGEVIILFYEQTSIEKLEEEIWEQFFTGMTCLFRYLEEKSIFSFNLSLFFGGRQGVSSWIYGRLCPRMSLPPWNTSDINYFEKLHGEVICVVSPEELCTEMRPLF